MHQLVIELIVTLVNISRLLEAEVKAVFLKEPLLKFAGIVTFSIFIGILMGYAKGYAEAYPEAYQSALITQYVLSR